MLDRTLGITHAPDKTGTVIAARLVRCDEGMHPYCNGIQVAMDSTASGSMMVDRLALVVRFRRRAADTCSSIDPRESLKTH